MLCQDYVGPLTLSSHARDSRSSRDDERGFMRDHHFVMPDVLGHLPFCEIGIINYICLKLRKSQRSIIKSIAI